MTLYLENLLQSEIYINERVVKIADLKWENHPVYEGVSMKLLLSGKDTDNKISKSLVKITKGCFIESHEHSNNDENIQFISGSGDFVLEDETIKIYPGLSIYLKQGTKHQIDTFDEDVYLIASFTPALY